MTDVVQAGAGGWVPIVIFIVIIGFKVISAIIKASKEAMDNSSSTYGDSEADADLWQPQAKPNATSKVPPKAPSRRSAPPPVPTPTVASRAKRKADAAAAVAPPPVPQSSVPKGISQEAASSIRNMESLDDGFENRQDRAYDLESSDVPMSSDEAFSLNKRSRVSRKKHVKINLKGKHLRNAIVAREILAPPRCFDI